MYYRRRAGVGSYTPFWGKQPGVEIRSIIGSIRRRGRREDPKCTTSKSRPEENADPTELGLGAHYLL